MQGLLEEAAGWVWQLTGGRAGLGGAAVLLPPGWSPAACRPGRNLTTGRLPAPPDISIAPSGQLWTLQAWTKLSH